jgi:prepilin-type N-terminal cleavage/methylation domain-containing protein
MNPITKTSIIRLSKGGVDGSAGFTIVELLVAIIVGVMFTMGANEIISSYSRIATSTRNLIEANSYAESKIESLRSIGYNGLYNGTTDIGGELPAELHSGSGSLQISTPSAGLKKIDLSLSYRDNGTAKSYSYTTSIGELGVGQ